MAAAFAFLGMLLTSLVVALIAALQLGDFFNSGNEFLLVLGSVAVFTTASLGMFALTYRLAAGARALNGIALLLAFAAVAIVLVPGLVRAIAARSTNPYTVGVENTYITLELLIPALLAVLVQWGLVRRRWLRTSGEEDLTLWPWVTTAVAGLAILNPVGLAFASVVLQASHDDWWWQYGALFAAAICGVLVVMAIVECYIRGHILRRRLESMTAIGGAATQV